MTRCIETKAKAEAFKNKLETDGFGKEDVKKSYMVQNYGAGDIEVKRQIASEQNISPELAEVVFDSYEKATASIAPEMAEFKKTVYDKLWKEILADPNKKEISWTLPDGFIVTMKTGKERTLSIETPQGVRSVAFAADAPSMYNRGILPNIIHSVDAYVARQMREKGFIAVHDAFAIPKGRELEAKQTYADILVRLNESDLMKSIIKQIDPEFRWDKQATLKSSDILKAFEGENGFKALATEHASGLENAGGKDNKKSLLSNKDKTKMTDAGKGRLPIPKDGIKSPEELVKHLYEYQNPRKTKGLVDQLVNDAGYDESLSGFRKDHDASERQLFNAFRSPEYNKQNAVSAQTAFPDAKVTPALSRLWEQMNRKQFNALRANLERNPAVRKRIAGERKFFDKMSMPIDKNQVFDIKESPFKTKREHIQWIQFEGKAADTVRKTIRQSKSPELKKVIIQGADDEILQTTPKKLPTRKQQKSYNFIRKEMGKLFDKLPEGMKSFVRSQRAKYSDDGIHAEQLNAAYDRKLTGQRKTAQASDNLKRYIELQRRAGDKTILNYTVDKVIRTDYLTLAENGLGSRADATAEGKRLSAKLKDLLPTIDQSVKGMLDSGEQHGLYRSSAKQIARKVGKADDEKFVNDIDVLMSIKAMEQQDGAWKFVEAGGDIFTSVLREIKKMDPDQAKGGFNRAYDGRKVFRDGKTTFDYDLAGSGGVMNLKSRTRGQIESTVKYSGKDMKDWTDTKKQSVAVKEKLLAVRGKGGHIVELREPIPEATHQRLGGKKDAGNVLSAMLAEAEAKTENVKLYSDETLKAMDYFLSDKPKAGFRRIPEATLARFPKELDTEKVKYYRVGNHQELFGNSGIAHSERNARLGNTVLKGLKMLNEHTRLKKQNTVMKNIRSHVNARVVNQVVGLIYSNKPIVWNRRMNDAVKQHTLVEKELRRIVGQGGKVTSAQIQRAAKRLDKLPLWKMEQAGLATNQKHGVTTEDFILGIANGDSKMEKIAQNLYLTPNSKLGQAVAKNFGETDTKGKYALAQTLMQDNGMSMKDAIREANGIYGDLSRTSSRVIEFADSHGAPFVKWWSQVAPAMIKTMVDPSHPERVVKAMAITLAMYELNDYLKDELEKNMGIRTDSWTLFGSVADMAIQYLYDLPSDVKDFIEMDAAERKESMERFIERSGMTILPAYMTNAMKMGEKVMDGKKTPTEAILRMVLGEDGQYYEGKKDYLDFDTKSGAQKVYDHVIGEQSE